MANLSNINNKFIVTDGGNILIGGNISGSSILQVTGTSTFTTSSTVLSLNRTGGATALIELKVGGTVEGYLGANTTKSLIVFNEAAAEKFSVSNGGNGTFAGNVVAGSSITLGASNGRVTALQGIFGSAFCLTSDGKATFGSTSSSIPIALAIDGAGASPALLIATNNNATFAADIIGNSAGTTEIGAYPTGGIKRIMMGSGGEIHFGDTTTSSALGLTEGAWDQFGDTDRLGLYCRNELKVYGNSNVLRLTIPTNGDAAFASGATFTGMITVQGGGIDIDNNDDLRLRFDNASVFKAGLQVPTTAGDMITGSAINDFAIRSQSNMLFATGGATERMRIDSAGNTTVYNDFIISNGSPEFYMTTGATHYNWLLAAQESINAAFQISSQPAAGGSYDNHLVILGGSGNVGIGTDSPDAKLEVSGDILLSPTNKIGWRYVSGNGYFNFITGEDQILTLTGGTWTSAATQTAVRIKTQQGEKVTIRNNGNVGIGTTSPLKILTVKKATSTTDIGTSEVMRLAGTAQAVGNRNELGFANYDFDYNASVVIGVEIMSTLGYLKQDLYFATRESTTDVAPTERMRIKSDGNVDIITPITNGFFGLSLKYSAIEVAVFKVNNATGQVDIGGNAVGYFPTLASGGIERIRITTAGDVLISKTILNPSVEGIELRESGQLNVASTVDQFNFYNTSAGVYRFFVTAAGAVHATSTSINAISDITLKENIKPLETGLNEVIKLQPRRFDWKNGDGKNIAGFIAQEVEEVLPDLVSEYKYTDEETKKSLKMGDMIPTLVKAIQELKAEVDILKNKPCKCNCK